jgi:tetratricopeptide (TPR) repeat protein
LLKEAHAFNKRHQYQAAIAKCDEALRIKGEPNVTAYFYTERCLATQYLERNAEALKDCNQALRLVPNINAALSYRAGAYAALKQYSKAIEDLTLLTDRGFPEQADLYTRRAEAYQHLGRSAEARSDWEQVTRSEMHDAGDFDLRAAAHVELGNYKAALADFKVAKNVEKPETRVLNSLAWLHATCPDAAVRHGKAAVADATRACELTAWKNPDYLDTLAAAYAEAGDFEQATRFIAQAVSSIARSSEPDALREHVGLIHARKPIRSKR